MKICNKKRSWGPIISRAHSTLVIISLFLTLTACSSAVEDASVINSAPIASNVGITDDNDGTLVVETALAGTTATVMRTMTSKGPPLFAGDAMAL